MADNAEKNDDKAAAPPIEHVLHVADREVCVRMAPMLAQVLSGLCAIRLRVSLLTDDSEMIARLDGSGVECHLVAHVAGWRAWELRALLASHFQSLPGVVHLWGTAGLWWLQRWAWRARVPVLIHALGESNVRHLLSRGLHVNQHLAVASAALAGPLRERFPLAIGRCQTILPAIAPPLHPAEPRDAAHTFSALCVGPFAEDCGLDILIDAVAQLRRDHPDSQVAIVGEGPGMDATWGYIRQRGVGECISRVDEANLWEKVLPEVDALVVPAAQREFSIAPLLAMGLGKVVIASRDQIGEWFIEDRTCWQFTPGSAVELAYLSARAIEQPKHARELSEAAIEYVRNHHPVRELIERIITLYGLAVRRSGAAAKLAETNSGRDAS